MPSTNQISFNLGLPSTPESSDPKLFYELVKIYNALNIISANIDGYTRSGTLSTTVDGKAPLDGTGATGTWGISVSGNAATVSAVSSAQVVSGLGFTPYNATNPAGYVTAASFPVTSVFGRTGAIVMSSADVISALGFTPYNVTNPSGYITSAGAPVQSVAGRTGTVVVTKTDVGLNNVDNTADASKPVSTAQATSLATKEPTIVAGTVAQYWRGDKTWVTLNSTAVGLTSVDNTSDANKPVSTAAAAALLLKANKADNLSVFAATTSAQLSALLSDETGTGSAVFASAPALISPTFLDGIIPNTSGTNTIPVPDACACELRVTAVQGGIGSSCWIVPCIKRGGVLAIGVIAKTVLSGEPINAITIVSNNLSLVVNAANTYLTYAVTNKVLLGA